MEQVDTALVELTEVIRRTVRVRTRDVHLIEDVTQETLVKVAEAHPHLADEALRSYAIVTARNTLAQHYRTEATARRHAHRLVEYRSFDGPEQRTLEREETDALAIALTRLDADDRELLLADEVTETPPITLASERGTSVRAISMRLARARAALRVEFVLAMRGIDDIPVQCRNTLHALSAGDRRRQRELDTEGHLARCSSCADLAQPVTQRRRSIAVWWLLLPLAEAIRRAGRSLRHNHVTQLAAVAVGATALTLGYLALRPTDTPAPGEAAAAVTPSSSPGTAAPGTTVPLGTTAPTAAVPVEDAAVPVEAAAVPVETAAPVGPAVPVETTVPIGIAVPIEIAVPVETTAPIEIAVPTAAVQAPPVDPCVNATGAQVIDQAVDGCVFELSGATVLDVPADEGFWITAPDGAPAWVHLVGLGESPITIRVGNVVNLRGTIRSHTPEIDNAGAPPDETTELQARTAHLDVAYADVTTR